MIKKATIEDFSFFKNLYFHPEINPFLLYEMEEAIHFEQIYNDLLKNDVLYAFEQDGVKVGMFKLVPLHYRTSHIAYLGGVAIHPDHKGKGLGYAMMLEIIRFGKEKGLLRMELSTATSNHAAIGLYEKVGFQQEGVLRNYTFLKSENRFLDEVLMSYLY
jgi:putative acetyltransferase